MAVELTIVIVSQDAAFLATIIRFIAEGATRQQSTAIKVKELK